MENKELLLKILEELQKINKNLEKINKREEEKEERHYMPLTEIEEGLFKL